jgi:dihydroorotase
MSQICDLVLKGGTVVNHDGENVRDLGIAGGRVVAVGNLAQASAVPRA